MRIHLITVVGRHCELLPSMVAHYRALGVESCAINVHLATPADPVPEEIRDVADRHGAGLESIFVGDWQSQQVGVWCASMQRRADDWCLLADHDELHVYPDELASLLAYCDRKGYDYITGAFVDRFAADGGFPRVDRARPLWDQFPLGGFVSYPMLGADPRKVVAAKGHVRVCKGQHRALSGVGCPMEVAFAQVHHFKWTAGLVDRLRARAAELEANAVGHWTESARFVSYYESHDGRIDLTDPRFLMAPCGAGYPFWPRVLAMAMAHHAQQLLPQGTAHDD